MLADRVILACTVLVAVIYLYATTLIPTLAIGDPLGPKAFPRLLGIALLIACGFFVVEMWRARRKDGQESPPAEEPKFEGKVVSVLLVVTFWTGCYYLVFESLGYIISTTLYLIPLTAWFNRGRWVANIVSTVGFTAFTYWLFVELEVRLPQGVLPF